MCRFSFHSNFFLVKCISLYKHNYTYENAVHTILHTYKTIIFGDISHSTVAFFCHSLSKVVAQIGLTIYCCNIRLMLCDKNPLQQLQLCKNLWCCNFEKDIFTTFICEDDREKDYTPHTKKTITVHMIKQVTVSEVPVCAGLSRQPIAA